MHMAMPKIGYGTYKRVDDIGYAATLTALEVGYRHLDTAAMYQNEDDVGRAMRASGLRRDKIFVTTKIPPENLGKGAVLRQAQVSLDKLQVSEVDLLLIHWPSPQDEHDEHDYLAQLGEVKTRGLAKHIGVSNFTKHYMDIAVKVLGASEIATNQVEAHVLLQNRPIVDYCQSLGVPITAYCPVARGALADHAGLKAIAAKHNATPEQVGLAFLLAQGHMIIPTSSRRENIISNWKAQDIQLSDSDIAAICAMDAGKRLVDGAWCPKWDT